MLHVAHRKVKRQLLLGIEKELDADDVVEFSVDGSAPGEVTAARRVVIDESGNLGDGFAVSTLVSEPR